MEIKKKLVSFNKSLKRNYKMTTKEIMELLLKDKKLTSKNWRKNQYIYLDKSGNLVDEKGEPIFFSIVRSYSFDTNSLEEYIEYVDFNTALNHMLNGGKAKRLVFGANVKLHCSNDGIILDEHDFTITLYKKDYIAKDWILL